MHSTLFLQSKTRMYLFHHLSMPGGLCIQLLLHPSSRCLSRQLPRGCLFWV
ncbi:hypothetical protein DPMN_076072 [Dreissena polymorpha]|uniref:Uncharacterized protein n=1 Tax=Dreissena polymorpha TaxID=45954 RepID=A0A9D4BN37_DREPO|nr:hypothetical protein DPMN_076072 [Dreissena polymorpha]